MYSEKFGFGPGGFDIGRPLLIGRSDYICTYVHIYACAYIYIYMYTYIYTYVYMFIYICMDVYVYNIKDTYISIYITYILVSIYTHIIGNCFCLQLHVPGVSVCW